MRKRSTEILTRLLRNPHAELSMKRLQEDYGLSEKTLRNDIQEIKDFVSENGLQSVIKLDNFVLKIEAGANAREILDLIYSMDLWQYKMSADERKIYVTTVLLYHCDYYSMQRLAEELYVTRNTIIDDCRTVKKFLQGYGIRFIALSKRGIRIETDEERRQRLLVDIFQELIPTLQHEKSFFVRFITKKFGFIHSLKDIVYHMNCYAGENAMVFTKDIFFKIAVCVFVLINHLQKVGNIKTEETSEELDTIGGMINYVVNELGCSTIDKNGIRSIERQVLDRNLNSQLSWITDFELYGVICHFLLEINKELESGIQSDTLLIESLIAHIKGMESWNDEDYDWNAWYDVSDEFSKVRAVAEKKFAILETYLECHLSRKMRDSIVIHICAAILRIGKDKKPLRVIISCPGSIATSKYLEVQLKTYFNFEVVGTFTTGQLEGNKENFERADFIISTVFIQKSPLPVVVVSPLLTMADIEKIRRQILFHDNAKVSDVLVRFPMLARIHSIYKSEDAQKINLLEESFKKILDDPIYRTEKNFMLTDMLKPEYIQVVTEALDWRTAISLSAKDLLRDGYVEESYIREAIEHVENYGSYIIINQGIALAHARKEAGVHKDAIALLTARQGIQFDGGHTVYLLFFFAQESDLDYVELMKDIVNLGSRQKDIKNLSQMPDAKQVHDLMKKILSNKGEQ